jgi:hypothetical protein
MGGANTECPVCGAKFKSNEAMIRHLEKHEKGGMTRRGSS